MWKYRGQRRPDFAALPAPGQESVWDYPRPPKLVPDRRLVEVYYIDQKVARSLGTYRVLETATLFLYTDKRCGLGVTQRYTGKLSV